VGDGTSEFEILLNIEEVGCGVKENKEEDKEDDDEGDANDVNDVNEDFDSGVEGVPNEGNLFSAFKKDENERKLDLETLPNNGGVEGDLGIGLLSLLFSRSLPSSSSSSFSSSFSSFFFCFQILLHGMF